MICDGQGCSVIAHLNCYFSARSKDANDAITDIEHWHCENCGGLPRHMHPRPRAAKRARVSFDPDLDVVTESPITEGGPATGYQGGGWGGHWPTRTELAQLTTGKGKEAMEPPITTSQRTLEDCSARLTLQPDHDVVVETTTCYFCRRADRWLYLTCGVCQLTTHANCYYRLRSDEADYYEKNTSDWRCQDCGGPQRHTDCALSENGQVVQRHVGTHIPKGGSATGHQGGGWGGHWPTRTEMAQLATGKGKEAMEPRHIPITPPPLRERGPKAKKRLNKNPNGHSHNQRNEYKGQGRKPSGHPPS